MRILVYTTIFPSSRHPNRGVYCMYGFRELAKLCEVEVVCPVPWHSRLGAPGLPWRVARERHGGLLTHYPMFWPVARIAPRQNPAFMSLATRPTVERIHRRFPFDAILAVWGYPDAVAALRLARHYRCPLVTNLLGSDINDVAARPQMRPLVAEALRASNTVVALSEAMAERVKALGVPAERVVVQYNGVDQERFCVRDRPSTRRKLGLPPDRSLVMFVGNLVTVKGPDVLVQAFAEVVSASPEPPLLVIVGDGQLRAELEQSIHDRRLAEHVRLIGARTHDQVPEWMSAADVLCLPSRMEGCPNVVLEAFASGLPVVASEVGGVPELVSEARGILVPPERPEALAEALLRALASTWNPHEIRQSVAHLTWEAFGRRFERLLKDASAEGPVWEMTATLGQNHRR